MCMHACILMFWAGISSDTCACMHAHVRCLYVHLAHCSCIHAMALLISRGCSTGYEDENIKLVEEVMMDRDISDPQVRIPFFYFILFGGVQPVKERLVVMLAECIKAWNISILHSRFQLHFSQTKHAPSLHAKHTFALSLHDHTQILAHYS